MGFSRKRRHRIVFLESRLCQDRLRLPTGFSFMLRSPSMMPRASPYTSKGWEFRMSTARPICMRYQEACMDMTLLIPRL